MRGEPVTLRQRRPGSILRALGTSLNTLLSMLMESMGFEAPLETAQVPPPAAPVTNLGVAATLLAVKPEAQRLALVGHRHAVAHQLARQGMEVLVVILGRAFVAFAFAFAPAFVVALLRLRLLLLRCS